MSKQKNSYDTGSRSGASCAEPILAWSIVGAAILGIGLSSLQRGSFKLHGPSAM